MNPRKYTFCDESPNIHDNNTFYFMEICQETKELCTFEVLNFAPCGKLDLDVMICKLGLGRGFDDVITGRQNLWKSPWYSKVPIHTSDSIHFFTAYTL